LMVLLLYVFSFFFLPKGKFKVIPNMPMGT
jgi:hypothetical protein